MEGSSPAASPAALHGAVLDVYPTGEDALPCRAEHAGGRITALRSYDPLTQRGLEEMAELVLGPASELALPEAAAGVPDAENAGYPEGGPRVTAPATQSPSRGRSTPCPTSTPTSPRRST